MADVRVRVLGPVAAEVDGRVADLGAPQRRALLARLAVADGAVVSTDRLVDDLWGAEAPPRALAGLQAHVSHLRRVLEPDRPPRTPASVLVSVAPGYALRVGDGLDAVRAASLRRRAADQEPPVAVVTLRAALALWTGPVLADLADEPWAGPEIERLTALRHGVLEALAAAELSAGTPAAAVDLLVPHVRDHPLREDAVRLLALALYRSGRQVDALSTVADLRRRLADDLGLDPSPALGELEHGILTHALDAPAVAPPAPPARPATPAAADPVLGRDPELARLTGAAGRARDRGALVLLTGEAGAGKTTLLDELDRVLGAQGWRCVRGRCPEVDGAPPGWAWTEVGDALGVVTPDDGPHRAFHAGRALRAALGAAVPVVVTLDDLHRGDDETLRLLRAVVSAASPGVLVVATLRPSEVDAELDATLASLAGVVGDRVELAGLGADGVAALLAHHGAGDAWDAAAITRRTGGNPLFVREVARLARTAGVDAASRTVPAGVRDVLRGRVAQLPAAAVSVLRRAAVVGREVDVAVLVALEEAQDPAAAEDRVLTAVEAAVLTGLVVESGPERVRFAHDLVREVLHDEVPRLRRARVHAAILTVLERLRPADRAALAHHALAAGTVAGVDRVLDHARAAADDARRDRSPRTAADLLGAALPLVGEPSPRRVAVRVALASALAHAGAVAPALEQRTAALAEAGTRASRIAAATCVDAPVSFAMSADAVLDRDLIAAVDGLLGGVDGVDDPADRARLLAARAFAWHPDEPERCRADTEAAEAAAAPVDDPLLRCVVLNARFWSLLTPERWEGLDEAGRVLLAEAERAGSWGHRTVGHHARFLHAAHRHRFDLAREHADAALAEAPDGQLAATLVWTSVFGALEALVAGRLDEAATRYEDVGAALAARGGANAQALVLLGLIGVREAQGRLDELVVPLREVHERVPELAADPLALALLAAGRPDEARAVWRPDVPVRRDWHWLFWTAMRARVAVALADTVVARACHRDLLPWSGHLAGAMSGTATLGPVDGDLLALEDLLGWPSPDRRAAATTLCDRLGAPHWRP